MTPTLVAASADIFRLGRWSDDIDRTIADLRFVPDHQAGMAAEIVHVSGLAHDERYDTPPAVGTPNLNRHGETGSLPLTASVSNGHFDFSTVTCPYHLVGLFSDSRFRASRLLMGRRGPQPLPIKTKRDCGTLRSSRERSRGLMPAVVPSVPVEVRLLQPATAGPPTDGGSRRPRRALV